MKLGVIRRIRWVLSILLFTAAFWVLRNLEDERELLRGVLAILLAIPALLMLVPEGVRLLGSPFLRWVDGLVCPTSKASRPPLNYRLASFYESQGRHQEAAMEYEWIRRWYPKETRPYQSLVHIYTGPFHRAGRLRWILVLARIWLPRQEWKQVRSQLPPHMH